MINDAYVFCLGNNLYVVMKILIAYLLNSVFFACISYVKILRCWLCCWDINRIASAIKSFWERVRVNDIFKRRIEILY